MIDYRPSQEDLEFIRIMFDRSVGLTDDTSMPKDWEKPVMGRCSWGSVLKARSRRRFHPRKRLWQ